MKTVCFIPARGGSVRVPRKNIRDFHGQPILAYSIQLAQHSGLFGEDIYVSTDDDEIAAVAIRFGAKVLRREKDDGSKGTQELAADSLPALGAVRYLCVLYATCPLLTEPYLRKGLDMVWRGKCSFAMSVGTEPLRDAGAFYWCDAGALKSRIPLIGAYTAMVPLPDDMVRDINTWDDWQRAETLYGDD